MTVSVQAPPNSDQQEIYRLLDSARLNGSEDKYTGKRRHTRYNVGLACELTTDPAKPSKQWFVSLHNLSGGGFACWSKTQLKPRTRIFLREFAPENPGAWISGQVCHCTPGLRGYLIGAIFENPVSGDGASSAVPTAVPTAARPPRPQVPPAYARVQLPTRHI